MSLNLESFSMDHLISSWPLIEAKYRRKKKNQIMEYIIKEKHVVLGL